MGREAKRILTRPAVTKLSEPNQTQPALTAREAADHAASALFCGLWRIEVRISSVPQLRHA